jgi:hypothetical protein
VCNRKKTRNPARLHESVASRLASSIKAKPSGRYAALTAPPFPLEKSPPPSRETPGFGKGKTDYRNPLVSKLIHSITFSYFDSDTGFGIPRYPSDFKVARFM